MLPLFRSLLILTFLTTLVACQSTGPSAPKNTSNEFAHGFFFTLTPQDTVLHIISGKDTVHLAASERAEPTFHCLSTTQYPFFEALDQVESIRGICYPQEIHANRFQEFRAKGRCLDILPAGELDKESMLTHPAGYVLYSSYDKPNLEFLPQTRALPFNEYLETHPLGRLEWIKVIGFLTKRYAQSVQWYAAQRSRYLSCKKSQSGNLPLMLYGSFDGEHFYIPANGSWISTLMQDAGFTSINTSNTTRTLDAEELMTTLGQHPTVVILTSTLHHHQAEQWAQQWRERFGVQVTLLSTTETDYFHRSITHPEWLLKLLGELHS